MVARKEKSGGLKDGATARIRRHYRRLGLDPGWDRDRFYRLCKMLSCTEYELGALCCVFSHRLIDQYVKRNRFPPHVSLHFALIESAFVQATCKVQKEPVMPIDLLTNG